MDRALSTRARHRSRCRPRARQIADKVNDLEAAGDSPRETPEMLRDLQFGTHNPGNAQEFAIRHAHLGKRIVTSPPAWRSPRNAPDLSIRHAEVTSDPGDKNIRSGEGERVRAGIGYCQPSEAKSEMSDQGSSKCRLTTVFPNPGHDVIESSDSEEALEPPAHSGRDGYHRDGHSFLR